MSFNSDTGPTPAQGHNLSPETSHSSLEQASNKHVGCVTRESDVLPQVSMTMTAAHKLQPAQGLSTKFSRPCGVAQLESPDDIYNLPENTLQQIIGGYEWLTIKAGVIISIQVQLLTSTSMASSVIPRAFLMFGVTSELVGVILVIYFIRFPVNPDGERRDCIRALVRGASEVPTFLVLMGIVGLAAALVVEMLYISIGLAITMSGVLIFGVIFCLLAWYSGFGGRAVESDSGRTSAEKIGTA